MKIKYFGASWCEPCKNYWPIVERAAGGFHIEKHDVEEDADIAATYGVRGVPTIVVLYDDGELIAVKQGAMSKETLSNFLHVVVWNEVYK